MQKIQLVTIDPQNSFCDPNGSLFVPGADKDMERLTTFVKRVGPKLDDIHVTLDSHRLVDIAHPIFWKDTDGNHPNPFTIISKDDVNTGKWTTNQPSHYKRALDYVSQLAKNDRYPLCIWPPHCLIGTQGHNVFAPLSDALLEWEQNEFATVDYVTKGSNIWTEHYSALQADVPDPKDPSTQINTNFINTLMEADYVVIAGEASSHCVRNTLLDVVAQAGDDFAKKMVLLKDCMSPVPGFEDLADKMFAELNKKGVKTTTSTEFLA